MQKYLIDSTWPIFSVMAISHHTIAVTILIYEERITELFKLNYTLQNSTEQPNPTNICICV